MKKPPLFIGIVTAVGILLLVIYGLPLLSHYTRTEAPPAEDIAPDERPPTPTVDFGNPRLGPDDAKVTLFVYSDFGCSSCGDYRSALTTVLPEFGNDVRMVWKDLPNTRLHAEARNAANAARCADEQGAFWKYGDLLFDAGGSVSGAEYLRLAESLGLDMDQFDTCIRDKRGDALVERDIDEAIRLGVDATPYTFVGDRRVSGALNAERLRTLLNEAVAAAGN